MLQRLAVVLAALTAFSLSAQTLVFQNVNVIPMTGEKILVNQTVVVRGDRIDYVGTAKFKMPDGTKVVDGTNKFLIPGLAEMHGHIPPPTAAADVIEDVLFLYAANGITTVRGMLGHPGQLDLRAKALRGEIVSPTLYLAGPSFNGNSINSVDEAVAKVKQQKKEGWDLLKVHPGLTLAEYDAMARTAKKERIRFGGHVPEEVGLLHAIEMGQETFDHVDGYAEYLDGAKPEIDATKLAGIVQRTKKAGAWIVPTMALWEVLFDTLELTTLQSYPELKYVSQQAVDSWSKAYDDRLGQMPREEARNIIRNRMKILKTLNDGGVKILMGTDAPQQFSVPGFSLHRELERMLAAGMTPYQILVSGTKNVGDYFAASDSFGTIEKGKRADLLLVNANPLKDIRNVSRISGVMLRGRWLPREEIDVRLGKIEAKYKR